MAGDLEAACSYYYSAAPIGWSWTRSIAVVAGGSMAEIWVKKRERY